MAKTTQEIYVATGRRKSAVARVRITPGKGDITVNKCKFDDYFPAESVRGYITQPLMITGKSEDYDVYVNLDGGGKSGQAGALRHGLARALEKAEGELRSVLKESGMLRRDPREKERKKYGQPGARKRRQFSKR